MSKASLPPTDHPQNVSSNRHQRKARANLPDITSNENEEIGEQYYLELHQKGTAGNMFFYLNFSL